MLRPRKRNGELVKIRCFVTKEQEMEYYRRLVVPQYARIFYSKWYLREICKNIRKKLKEVRMNLKELTDKELVRALWDAQEREDGILVRRIKDEFSRRNREG